MLNYEEVISGYKKSMGLLKQIDPKVYRLFIRELKRVGAEEVYALMAGLKYNMRVQESKENGIATDIKCHNLDNKYIKGKSQVLRLSIINMEAFSLNLEKRGIFGKQKQFVFTLFPLTKTPNDFEETTFAVSTKLVDHSNKSRNFYTVRRAFSQAGIQPEKTYTVKRSDHHNISDSETTVSSIPEEESILTTPVVGY